MSSAIVRNTVWSFSWHENKTTFNLNVKKVRQEQAFQIFKYIYRMLCVFPLNFVPGEWTSLPWRPATSVLGQGMVCPSAAIKWSGKSHTSDTTSIPGMLEIAVAMLKDRAPPTHDEEGFMAESLKRGPRTSAGSKSVPREADLHNWRRGGQGGFITASLPADDPTCCKGKTLGSIKALSGSPYSEFPRQTAGLCLVPPLLACHTLQYGAGVTGHFKHTHYLHF